MASGAERLKEFVVGLGFQIDEQQFRNFGKVLEKVTENIAEIGAATAIVAAVIDKNVTVIAARFEKLYYASQRTGASVKGLEDIEYGAQQIGLQAGAATSAIEGMTAAMRTNPGKAQLFKSWFGGETDPTKQFVKIIDHLKEMDPNMGEDGTARHGVAAQFAAMLGISEPDFLMYEKGNEKLKALMAERDAQFRAAGLDPDKAGKDSAEFMNEIRKLGFNIEIIESLIEKRFLPAIEWLVTALGRIAGAITRADKATGGASTYGLGALGVAGAFGGLKLLPKIVRGLLGISGGAAAEGAALGAGEGAAAGAGAGGAAAVAAELLPVVLIVLGALGLSWLIKHTGAADVGGQYSAHSQVNQFRKWIGLDSDGTGDSFTKKFEGWRSKAYGDIGKKATIGFGHLIKAGEHFGVLSKEEGEALYQKDMASAMGAVSSMTRGRALTSGQMAALSDFQYNTGALGNSKLLRLVNSGRMDDAAKAFEMYDGFHDKSGIYHHSDSLMKRRLGEEALFRGGGSSSVNAQTTIHVTVDKNPRQNAQAIGDEQARVNSDLLRNMRPKVN